MEIAIIGAGLSGIVAAKELQLKLGQRSNITIFEKSQGSGGRMSTRRTDQFEFDHGAQYFTAKDVMFKAAVDEGIKQGFIAPWSGLAKYLKDGKLEPDTGSQRYVSTPRMNSWIKAMADGLDIKTSQRVSSLSLQINSTNLKKWTLSLKDGTSTDGFDYVICAVPAPQAEALLSPINFSHTQSITDVQMEACLAVMVGFENEMAFPWETLRSEDGPASWIAVNSAKPGRPVSGTTLMVHSGSAWSAKHVDRDKAELQAEILADVTALTGVDMTTAMFTTIHRWLYAAVSKGAGQDCLSDPDLGVIACGDWCVGGRVEGAYLSGVAAANQIVTWAN